MKRPREAGVGAMSPLFRKLMFFVMLVHLEAVVQMGSLYSVDWTGMEWTELLE